MSQKIAEERIQKLFELADKRMEEDRKNLADRYVELAQKIGMKYQLTLSSKFRRKICDECGSYLRPGTNCKVRINSKNSTINYHCRECGAVNRHGC